MTYSFKTIASLGLLALISTGCDKEGSLGELPTTSEGSGGSEGTGGETGTEAGSATESGSAESGSATETSADSGVVGCGPGQCEVFPIDCGPDGCGGLGRIDEEGCFRPGCSTDEECGDDERCYRPMDFGNCVSSDVFCEDNFETMQCECGSTDDCGGSYCVPADVYPTPAEGPSDAGIVADDCAPDDGPAMAFSFGLANDTCGDPAPPESAVVRIRIDYFDDTVVTHEFGITSGLGWGTYDAGDGVLVDALFGHLNIDAWDAGGVTGSYDIVLEDGSYYAATFEGAAYCPEDPMCG